jgi:hypothetical protein
MSALDRLPGTWDLDLRHADIDGPVRGRQTYGWVLDEAFLRLDWTYEHPAFPDALALYGPDRMHYFDVRGIVRVFDLDLGDDGWSMVNVTGDGLSQRATARFTDDDTVAFTGERSTDTGATWQPDYTMTLRRADR